MGDICPHREDFAIKDSIGESIESFVIDRDPEDKFFIHGFIEKGIDLRCGIAEAAVRPDAGDEEIIIVRPFHPLFPVLQGSGEIGPFYPPVDIIGAD